MAVQSHYLLCVSMDVEPEYEDLFNEVYDTEHIPQLLKVPGVQDRQSGHCCQWRVGECCRDWALAGWGSTAYAQSLSCNVQSVEV